MIPQKTKGIRRFAWVCVIAFIASLVLLLFIAGGSRYRYRSYTLVSVAPFTNTVLQTSFQTNAFRSLPGIRVEQAGPSVIRITADGTTVVDARQRSKDATEAFRAAIEMDYGGKLSVLDSGDRPFGVIPRVLETLQRPFGRVLK
jgi:hypothetical protein